LLRLTDEMALMDNETGEIVQNVVMECNLDVETGECVGNESDTDLELRQGTIRKTKFNVPKSYLTEPKNPHLKNCLDRPAFTLTSKKRVIDLKEVNLDEFTVITVTIQNFFLENHSRLQQNEPSAVSHSFAVHVSSLGSCHNRGDRNHAARLEPQQKHEKR